LGRPTVGGWPGREAGAESSLKKGSRRGGISDEETLGGGKRDEKRRTFGCGTANREEGLPKGKDLYLMKGGYRCKGKDMRK